MERCFIKNQDIIFNICQNEVILIKDKSFAESLVISKMNLSCAKSRISSN